MRAEIEKYFEAAGMSQSEVVARLVAQARANPIMFFNKRWRIKRAEVEKNGHLIRKLKVPSRGKPAEIELHDGQAALIKVGMHLGLFRDKVQVVGDSEAPVRHEMVISVAGVDTGSVEPRKVEAIDVPSIPERTSQEGQS